MTGMYVFLLLLQMRKRVTESAMNAKRAEGPVNSQNQSQNEVAVKCAGFASANQARHVPSEEGHDGIQAILNSTYQSMCGDGNEMKNGTRSNKSQEAAIYLLRHVRPSRQFLSRSARRCSCTRVSTKRTHIEDPATTPIGVRFSSRLCRSCAFALANCWYRALRLSPKAASRRWCACSSCPWCLCHSANEPGRWRRWSSRPGSCGAC